jgi:hypothetical protein
MNTQIHSPIRVTALAAALFALTAPVGAQVAITDVHVDIGLEQPSGDWGVHIHDEDNDEEYAPDAAYFLADPAFAGVTRPAGAQWDFLGGIGGDTIYVLPQGQQAGLPFLGFSAEEVTPGTFDSYFNSDSRVNASARWIGWRITAVSGPGDFSIWQSGQFGTPTVWVSTAQGGLTSADTVFIQEGGHAHFNWGSSPLDASAATSSRARPTPSPSAPPPSPNHPPTACSRARLCLVSPAGSAVAAPDAMTTGARIGA